MHGLTPRLPARPGTGGAAASSAPSSAALPCCSRCASAWAGDAARADLPIDPVAASIPMKVLRFTDLVAQGQAQGKRVFIRADLNVPQDGAGNITEDTRIRASVP